MWICSVVVWVGVQMVLILFYFCRLLKNQFFHDVKWNMALFSTLISDEWILGTNYVSLIKLLLLMNWFVSCPSVRVLCPFSSDSHQCIRRVPIRLWVLPCCNSLLYYKATNCHMCEEAWLAEMLCNYITGMGGGGEILPDTVQLFCQPWHLHKAIFGLFGGVDCCI